MPPKHVKHQILCILLYLEQIETRLRVTAIFPFAFRPSRCARQRVLSVLPDNADSTLEHLLNIQRQLPPLSHNEP